MFVAALTVSSAHFIRLGNSQDTEHALEQAEEILKHFSHRTWQGKRYGLIIKKLSKSAKDYALAMERKERLARKTAMPELFSFNPPVPNSVPENNTSAVASEHNTVRNQSEDSTGFLHDHPTHTTEEALHMGETLLSYNSITDPSFWNSLQHENLWLPELYTTSSDILPPFQDGGNISWTETLSASRHDNAQSDMNNFDRVWGLD